MKYWQGGYLQHLQIQWRAIKKIKIRVNVITQQIKHCQPELVEGGLNWALSHTPASTSSA
jgi:hypothetical protein